jgi:hypothetical protein
MLFLALLEFPCQDVMGASKGSAYLFSRSAWAMAKVKTITTLEAWSWPLPTSTSSIAHIGLLGGYLGRGSQATVR